MKDWYYVYCDDCGVTVGYTPANDEELKFLCTPCYKEGNQRGVSSG